MKQQRFGKAYYDRFYREPATRSSTPLAVKKQAVFIAAYLEHLNLAVMSILDIGCGVGSLPRTLGRCYPSASRAQCLCAHALRLGAWSVINCNGPQADLVQCNDVVPYLDDEEATRAINNLAQLTGTALFFGALTRADWPNCDKARTDALQYIRSDIWYRTRLERHFERIGGGLYLKTPVKIVVWSLDHG